MNELMFLECCFQVEAEKYCKEKVGFAYIQDFNKSERLKNAQRKAREMCFR